MQYGLNRIILIDSYIAKTACEFKVNGHTNITGRNGAGKTAFLRLIPIFMGEVASKLSRADKSSGNKSFSDFYLPRQGSYVIFEYFSQGELKMVVLIGSSQSDTRHRQLFVDSGYLPELFIDEESSTGLSSDKLVSRLSTRHIDKKVTQSNIEYQNILLDATVRKYQKFSISPANSKLSKLTHLFTGMFKREANFNDLRQIIQGWCLDDMGEKAQQNLKHLGFNRDDISNWLANYNAFVALEDLKPSLPELETLYNSIKISRKDISAILSAADYQKESLKQESEILKSQYEEITDKSSKCDVETENIIQDLKNKISPLKKEELRIQAKIDAINSLWNEYQDKNLPSWERKQDKLPSLHIAIQQKEEQLVLAEQDVEAITTPILQKIAKFEISYSEQLQKFETSKDTYRVTQAKEEQQLKISHQATIQDLEAKQNKNIDKLQGRVSQCDTNIGIQETRMQLAQATEKTRREQEKLQSLLQSKRDNLSAIEEKEEVINVHIEILKKDDEQAEKEYQKAKDKADKVDTTIRETFALRDGGEDTLLHYLRTEYGDWEQNIGRVIDDDLLLNNKLNPQSALPLSDLYGVRLSLDSLPIKDRSEEALDLKIKRLQIELEQLQKAENQSEKRFKKSHKLLKQSLIEYEEIQSLKRECKNDCKNTNSALTILNGEVHKEKLAYRKSSEVKLRDLNLRKLEYVENHKLAITEKQNIITEAKASNQTQSDGLKNQYTLILQEIDSDKTKATELLQADKTLLKSEQKRRLEEKGVNTETINKIKRGLSGFLSERDQILEKQIQVRAYKRFLSEEYSKLSEYEGELAKTNEYLSTCVNEKNQIILENKQRLQSVNRQIENNQLQQNSNIRDQDALINQVLTDHFLTLFGFGAEPIDTNIWVSLKPTKLRDKFRDLLTTNEHQSKELLEVTSRFVTIFQNHPHTRNHDYWSEKQKLWSASNFNHTEDKASAIIEYFRNKDHEQTKIALLNNIQDFNKLDIYRQSLEIFNKLINQYSSQLSEHIDENLNYDALSEIKPNINFDLNKLDHWAEIKNFSSEFSKFNENKDAELPSATFVLALKNFRDNMLDSRASIDATDLWRHIDFSFDIIENGNIRHIHNIDQINNASSNGLSYLILITLFLAFIDMQRGERPIHFCWALDELLSIDSPNVRALLDTLFSKNIYLISACPDLELGRSKQFKNRYRIDLINKKMRVIELKEPPVKRNPFKKKEVA